MQKVKLEPAVALLRLQEHLLEVVVARMVKVSDCESQRHGSMVAPKDFVQARVLRDVHLQRGVVLIEDTVAIGRCLVFLVDVVGSDIF